MVGVFEAALSPNCIGARAGFSRVATVPPAGKSLHTTPACCNCWDSSMSAARLSLGRGQLCFPQVQARALARASSTFSPRRPSRPLFCRPAAPGQNRRRPGVSYRCQMCSRGSAAPTVLPACPERARLPQSVESDVHRRHVGTPRRSRRPATRTAPLLGMACAGPAAVLHRLSRPCRGQLFPRCPAVESSRDPRTRQQSGQGRRLDAAPSSRWCHRERRFGAIGPGVLGCRFERWRGCSRPSTVPWVPAACSQ